MQSMLVLTNSAQRSQSIGCGAMTPNKRFDAGLRKAAPPPYSAGQARRWAAQTQRSHLLNS